MDPVDRIWLDSLEAFVAACSEQQIRGAAMRVVDELRLRVRPDGCSEIAPQNFVELFAYRAGVVYAAVLHEVDAAAVEATLVSAGLKVRRRSGNLD